MSVDIFAQENRLYYNSNCSWLQHFSWKVSFAYCSLNYKLIFFCFLTLEYSTLQPRKCCPFPKHPTTVRT